MYVRSFAHCEYGNGFLVFDRFHPHSLEIWRLTNEWDGTIPESNVLYRPDEHQLSAPRRILDVSGRGSFSPWALFTPRENPRAYRFVYPHLLVGSEWGQELYVFDVTSATLQETIPIPETAAPPGGQGVQINYVELGERHVFVCTPYSMLIIPRFQTRERRQGSRGRRAFAVREEDDGNNSSSDDDREPVRYIDFPNTDPELRSPQLVRHYAARMSPTLVPGSNEAMKEFYISAASVPERSTALVPMTLNRQEFTAGVFLSIIPI